MKWISIRRPTHSPVLLLYNDREDLFRGWVLKDIPYRVLSPGSICLHPLVVLRTLRLLLGIDWRYIQYARKPILGLIKQLYERHLQAYVEAISPRVVMTWVDDSGVFHRLSRKYSGAEFFAVQNGLRLRWFFDESLPKSPHPGAIISMPDLFCLGYSDMEAYKAHGHQVDRCHPIGSLVGGVYWGEVAGERKITHDLCYVSQWECWVSTERNLGQSPTDKLKRAVYDGLGVLHALLVELIDHKGYSLLVALRYDDCQEEKAYYRQKFGDRIEFQDSSRKNFSTYRAIDRARLTINLASTCGAEALGFGRRVLFCNGSGDSSIGLPEAGYCYFEGDDYALFSERVGHLLSMSDDEYQALVGCERRKLVNYDLSFLPHEQLRHAVLSSLAQ